MRGTSAMKATYESLSAIRICHLFFVRIWEIRNANGPIVSTVTPLKMLPDSPLRCLDIGIITVIQDHQLDITENRFHRIIIGTAFGQRDPMQL
jgi:hypothetical protein